MSLISSILLFLAGLVGAAPMVVRKFPGIRPTIDSIRRYSSMIGLYLLIVGIIKVLRHLSGRHLDIADVAIMISMLGLGFLQGFEFILELFRNNDNLTHKSENFKEKLIKYQEVLGIVALVVSVLAFFRII